jgi:hypothetical protein
MVAKSSEARMKRWGALLSGLLLASMLAFLPSTAQASTSKWWHPFKGDSALPGFWLTGEVVEVEAGSVTVQLPNHRHGHGMMRYVNLQVSFEVDAETVLLNDDLAALELTTLVEGDEVVVVPGLVWGNLVARLLYAGDPKDLAEASHRGRLVEDNGDTLTLESGRDGELTVQVDDATIWYDNGQMERPAELAEELQLRVLGIAVENEAGENEAGDEVIRAVLITPGK